MNRCKRFCRPPPNHSATAPLYRRRQPLILTYFESRNPIKIDKIIKNYEKIVLLKKLMYKIRPVVRFTLSFLIVVSLASWLLISNQQIARAVAATDIHITEQNQELIISIRNPQNVTLTWQYSQNISVNNCNENAVGELTTIDNGSIRENQTVLRIDSANPYCFKITDETNNQTIWKAYQPITTVPPVDTEGPNINIRRTRNNLINISSDDENLDLNSWRYAKFSRDPDCSTARIDNNLPASHSNNLIIREDDNGQWYCFKVADRFNNLTFSKYKIQGVDTTPPEIIIEQNGRLLTATSEDRSAHSWIYFFSPSDINCDNDAFLNNRSVVRGNQITLTADRINYNYCFQVSDTIGNFGFQKHKVESVDFRAPVINMKQNGLTITVDSDAAIKTWHYLKVNTNARCDDQTDFATAVNFSDKKQIALTRDDHQLYFCVRGINSINSTSFAKIRVDTQKPQVELVVETDSISASADKNIESWEYLKTEREPDCTQSAADKFEEASFDKHQGQKSQLSKLDNGLWFCFRATDKFSNSGYAKKQISGITHQAPGENTADGRDTADIAIIVGIIILAVSGFLVHTFLQKRRQAMISGNQQADTANDSQSSGSRRRKRKNNETPVTKEEIIQPLDYLKRDKDK